MKRTFALLGFTALAGFILIAVVSTQSAKPPVFQGSLIDPPILAKDFLLHDQNGQPFRLSDQHGKVVLLYFGYTYCPDVCPATLVDFKRIREGLGDRVNEVEFVFITVDPDRDTTDQMKNYLGGFAPNFIGLRDEPPVLQQVWADYGIAPQKQPGAGTAGYLVDHPARVYVIDRSGNLRLTFPFGLAAEAMLHDVLVLFAD